ncbi:MAG: hypothetical protein F4X30_11330 [Acidimicrobiaceae bacterium]|nr:hypothetical protein [Acidimicrobiaceae bacterium]
MAELEGPLLVVLGYASSDRRLKSMQVEQLIGDRLRVTVTSQTALVLIAAKYLPRPLRDLPTVILGNTLPADSPGALMSAVAGLPDHMTHQQVIMMPDSDSGLYQPWREPSGSALLLRAPTAYEISFQRKAAIRLLVDPETLPVPPVGQVLCRAAEAVLGTAQSETLLRVALHWAFACEISHRPWAHNRTVLRHHALSAPEPNRQRLNDAPHRLIVPQTVRLIATDAVCSRSYTDAAAAYDPGRLSASARSLVAAFLPSAVTGRHPAHSEIRSALWILAYCSPFESLGDEAPAMLMAHTFGTRSIGEPQEALRHWCELLSLRDDHPHGSWGPGHAPSDLRADLRSASGLEMRDVAAAVHWMLTAMMAVQDGGNQLFTHETLVQLAENTLGDAAEAALAFAGEHLTATVGQLRDSLRLDDVAVTGDSRADAAAHRRCIEQRFVERPFIRFDDGTVVPVGIPDAVYGTIELCQAAHRGQDETPGQRRQRIGNTLGYFFEARVREMCHSLDGRSHLVLDSDVIDEVMDHEVGRDTKRADVVIGDNDGNYLVVEATKRNLLAGIRYGERAALESWVEDHLGKREQALTTAEHLRAITAACNVPPPRSVACLVVGDLPLRQDVGLSAIFDARSGTRLRPFLCGITEFEILLERGRWGFSVPTVALAWQYSGTDESLGLFLSQHPSP